MGAVPSPPLPRRRRAGVLLVLAVLLVGGLLGGCARARVALALQSDDTVTGDVFLGTPAKGDGDKGITVTPPPDLRSLVTVTPHAEDGYVGSRLTFSGLDFAQVGELAGALAPAGHPPRLQIRRVGGRVLVSGRVDLTTVPVDAADFELKISFPGSVVDTDGTVDGNTVSWKFVPGTVGDVAATVAAADPNAPSITDWVLGLAAGVALVAVGVVLVARRVRNPPVTPPVR